MNVTIDVASKTSEKYVKQQRRERLKFKLIHIYTLITYITKHINCSVITSSDIVQGWTSVSSWGSVLVFLWFILL